MLLAEEEEEGGAGHRLLQLHWEQEEAAGVPLLPVGLWLLLGLQQLQLQLQPPALC